MLHLARAFGLFFVVAFLLPVAATVAWWSTVERPGSWRAADWSASDVLPAPARDEAAIYVMAARTGGLKGAFSVHSWIVTKTPGEAGYVRYDKVGWGSPIRRNGYAADARWYSNVPTIVGSASGADAARLLPLVEAAIEGYPYDRPGDYRIWPGPNSNSFVAHVLREVPELGIVLPPNATGRDFAPGWASFTIAPDGRDVHATVGGLAGFAFGARSGFEVHLLGQAAGLDFTRPALKLPAAGLVALP